MSCGSGSSGSNTTVQKTQVPASVSAGIDTLMNQGIAAANQPYQNYTGPRNAPFSPDQLAGFGAAEGAATAYQPWMTVAGQQLTAGSQPVTTGSFDQAAFDQYGNPYSHDVIDQTMQELQRQNQIQGNYLDSKATMAGAFGGDRAGIERTEQDRNNSQVMGQTLAGLNNQNWQQAQAQYNTDQARRLQAQQGNQQVGLAAAQAAGNLGAYDQNLGLAGANALLGVGGQQQQEVQNNLNTAYGDFLEQRNYPWQQAQNLAGIIHGYPSPSSTSTTTPAPSAAGQIAGGLTAGVGLLSATGAFGSNGWMHFNRGGLANVRPRRGAWRYGYEEAPGGGFERKAPWAPNYASGGLAAVPTDFAGLPVPGGDSHRWTKAYQGFLSNDDPTGYTAWLQANKPGRLPAPGTPGTPGTPGGTPAPTPAPTPSPIPMPTPTAPYPGGPPVSTSTLPPSSAAFYGPGVTGAGNPDVDAMRQRMATAGTSGLALASGGRVALADGGGLNFNPGNDQPMTDYSRLPAHSLAYMAQQGDRQAAAELQRRVATGGLGAVVNSALPNSAPTGLDERPPLFSGPAAQRPGPTQAPGGLPSAGIPPTGLATAAGPLAPAFRGDPSGRELNPSAYPPRMVLNAGPPSASMSTLPPGSYDERPPVYAGPAVPPARDQVDWTGLARNVGHDVLTAFGAKSTPPSPTGLEGGLAAAGMPENDYEAGDMGAAATGATPASGLDMPASGLAAANGAAPPAGSPTGIAAAGNAFAPSEAEGGVDGQMFTPVSATEGEAPPADPVASANTGLKAAVQAPEGSRDVPKWAMPMMMAGFAMMASRSPHLLSAVGEGGLAGIQGYTQQMQWDAQNRRLDIADKRATQQIAYEQDRNRIADNRERDYYASVQGKNAGKFTPLGMGTGADPSTGQQVQGAYVMNNVDGTTKFYPGVTPGRGSAGSGGGTMALVQRLITDAKDRGETLDTEGALKIIHDPAGKNKGLVDAASRRLAEDAAKNDPTWFSDPEGAINKWMKYFRDGAGATGGGGVPGTAGTRGTEAAPQPLPLGPDGKVDPSKLVTDRKYVNSAGRVGVWNGQQIVPMTIQ